MWEKRRYGFVIGISVFLLVLNFILVGFPGAIEFLIGGLFFVIRGFATDSAWPILFVHGCIWPFSLIGAYVFAKEVYKPKSDAKAPDKDRTKIFFAALFVLSVISAIIAMAVA